MSENSVPEYLRDYIKDSGKAMVEIASYIKGDEAKWKEIVSIINQEFAVHNAKTELLCTALTNHTEAVQKNTEQAKQFRDEVWTKMWNLLEKVILLSVGTLTAIAGGSAILSYFFPGLGT